MTPINETTSIAPIPEGWTRTSRPALLLDGIEWRSYRTGINAYAVLAEHETMMVVSRNYDASTYGAGVGGKGLGKRFRSETAAMLAAIKHLKTL